MGYGGEGSQDAVRDDQTHGDKRTTGDGGALVRDPIVVSGQTLNFFDGVAGFVGKSAGGPLAHHQMRLDSRTVQHLQQPDSENGSGGAGDAHYQSRRFTL